MSSKLLLIFQAKIKPILAGRVRSTGKVLENMSFVDVPRLQKLYV